VNPEVTVAIPTFNRPGELGRTLDAIIPQLRERDRLLVLDNNSPVPVSEAQAQRLAGLPANRVRVVRHPANVGAGANVLRCFELCETDWIWPLGDDDAVNPAAVANILAAITRHPDAVYLGFSSNLGGVVSDLVGRGTVELADRLPAYANFNFLSSGVYRADRMKPHLALGHEAIGSWGPHVALVLAAVGEGGKWAFVPEVAADHVLPPDLKDQWSMMTYLLRQGALLELFGLPSAARRALADLIERQHKMHEYVTINLLLRAAAGDPDDARFFHGLFTHRAYHFSRSPVRQLKVLLYRQLFRMPRLAVAALKLALRMTGQSGRIRDNRWGARV
jgi:glycosyltransferase involved in cell wall biosynthesis